MNQTGNLGGWGLPAKHTDITYTGIGWAFCDTSFPPAAFLRECYVDIINIHVITAINDPAIDVQYICYLIKFDSTHGKFNGSITHTKDEILVNDRPIKIFHEKLPANIPWHSAKVQYVIESSGMFTTMEKASGHLASETVRRVILTAPSIDVPMLILGVNDDNFNSCQKVISCASSTLYCLAPIVKVLEDSFGLIEGFVTSIHAMTPSLKPLDGLCLRGKHWRDHRSIHQNIIPAMTGACKALAKIVPSAKDKLCGLAFRVPIVNVSVLDLTIRLKSSTSLQEIIQKVEKASNSTMKNIIQISNESAVSSDFIGETHSCILDVDSSLQMKPFFFKLVCWYENEYSYACRVIDTIAFFENNPCPICATLSLVSKQDGVQQTDCCQKEVAGSTSQDTGLKYKNQHLILRKPLSTQLCSNVLPLTCNGEKQPFNPGVRQNRNCIFHSCIAITPRNLEQKSAVKAQDRLEMLKKEFSKMVNVTESLLKKSYTSNFSEKSHDKHTNENFAKNADGSLGRSYESLSDIYNVNNRMFGDCNSDFGSFNDKSLGQSSNKKLNGVLDHDNKEKDQCYSKFEGGKSKYNDEKTEISKLSENNIDKNTFSQSTSVNQISMLKFKFTAMKPDLVNSVQERLTLVNQNDVNSPKANKKGANQKENGAEDTENKNVCHPIVETRKSVTISKNLIDELNAKLRSHKTESKMQSIVKLDLDVAKSCEKDKTINPTTVSINSKDITDGNVKNGELDDDSVDNLNLKSLPGEDDDFNKRLLNLDRISTRRYSFLSERTSICGSPGGTSLAMSYFDSKNKEDIYDKLDSISGTDSNNSFQIHERKSQVIDLNDLTNSLEDLNRLDKICKIIEISDELSNKLFSPLNSNDETQSKDKAWSFKDLCEKIKLDEFCENVFGKSSS